MNKLYHSYLGSGLVFAALLLQTSAAPLGTGITYQGRLKEGDSPLTGEYDLRFSLYNALAGGSQVGGTLTKENVGVSQGVFTTTLDFGANIFTGGALWLEISVRPGNSNGAFTPLDPRQPVTPTPYALYALTPAGPQGPPGSADAWARVGNAGTTPANNFLGTTDNQPFEIRVNNARALRLEPDSSPANAPNVIGGSPLNMVTPGIAGAVIAGGGSATSLLGALAPNTVQSDYGAVGGGGGNTASGLAATVPGGWLNEATGDFSFAAGFHAKANHPSSFVWSDLRLDGDFNSTSANQFLIHAAGGVGIGHNNPNAPLHVVGGADANYMGGGILVLGAVEGANVVFDGNEILARNNRVASTLYLNASGGNVSIGTTASAARLHVVANSDVRLDGGGILVLGAVSAANVAFDGNEIQARSNRTASALYLNADGGNVSVGTTNSDAPLRVIDATCDGSSWINASDRNLKEGFEPVDTQAILAKVAALPITRWNYTNAPGPRHVGPVAQDFQAAFGLGADDKSIATIDADGIALAAIQGLNQKLESELKSKDVRIAALEQDLAELRQAVQSFKRADGAR